jgi:hypothetical protein
MVKILKKPSREVINLDSGGYILDSEGQPTDEMYDPLEGMDVIRIYYWYNDLQGRFKQDTRPPGLYRGRPRIFVKEAIEKVGNNVLKSHMLVYYGKKLLAIAGMVTPEYNIDEDGNRNDDDIRFQVRAYANKLISQSRAREDEGKFKEGAWEEYKISKPFKEFRKKKSSQLKTKRKPVTKKIKKVVRKKVVKKRK